MVSRFCVSSAVLLLVSLCAVAHGCNFTLLAGDSWSLIGEALGNATGPGDFVVCVECNTTFVGCDTVDLLLAGGGAVVVQSKPDCEALPVIDCDGSGPAAVANATGVVATLRGLNFTNGEVDSSEPGAIVQVGEGASVSVEDVVVVGCSGGAFHATGEGTTLSIINSEFSHNYVTDGIDSPFQPGFAFYGSVAAVDYGAVGTVANSVFSNNHVDYVYGGAVVAGWEGNLSVHDSEFTEHVGDGSAVGSYGGLLELVGCSFFQNFATTWGGAVEVLYGSLFADKCDFLENSAINDGGAISAYSAGVVDVRHSSFVGNSATDATDGVGGAMWIGGAQNFTIAGCSFDRNSVPSNGGAIYSRDSSSDCTNSTFTGNLAENGGAVYVRDVDSDDPVLGLFDGCEFRDNSAALNGGAVAGDGLSTVVSLHSSVVTGSSATTGAVYIEFVELIANGTHFLENSAETGGAVASFNGPLGFVACVFMNNTARTRGGAIAGEAGEIMHVNSSVLLSNTAETGGAIYSAGVGVVWKGWFSVIFDSIFENNVAVSSGGSVHVQQGIVKLFGGKVFNSTAQSGGAFSVSDDGHLIMRDSTVVEAFATDTGGAISIKGGELRVVRSRFLRCRALLFGGTFYGRGDLSIADSTVSHSSAAQIGGALLFASGVCSFSNTTIEFTLGDTAVVAAVDPVVWSGGELSCNGVLKSDGAVAENVEFSDDPLVHNNYIFDDATYVSAWPAKSSGTWVTGGSDQDPRQCVGAPTLCDAFTCYNNGTCVEADGFTDPPTCDCSTTDPGPKGGEYVGRLCDEICGNGVVEGDEPCDDGNTDGGDGCSSACDSVAEGFYCESEGEPCTTTCGDGEQVGDEECDNVDNPKCVSCEFVGSRILNDWEAAVTALVPLAVIGLIAAGCWYLDGRYPGTRHMDLLWMIVALLDVGTDIAFAAEVYIAGYGRAQLNTTLFHVCVVVIAFGLVANGVAIVFFVSKESRGTHGHEFKAWMFGHSTTTAVLFFLATTNLGVLRALDSRIFTLGMFSAPLSHGARARAHAIGVVTNVFEDVPQIAVQTYYLFGTGAQPTIVIVVSLCISAFVLLSSLASRLIKLFFLDEGIEELYDESGSQLLDAYSDGDSKNDTGRRDYSESGSESGSESEVAKGGKSSGRHGWELDTESLSSLPVSEISSSSL